MENEGSARPAPCLLDAYRFEGPSTGWVQPRTAPGDLEVLPTKLRFVTFNVWFGQFFLDERLRALLDLLIAQRPDIVALQEVTPRHLERILEESWIREGYWVSDAVGETVEPNGVLLLSRLPLRHLVLCRLPSRKSRKFLVGEIESTDQTLYVGNVHLESSPLAAPLRLAQLDTVLPSLHGARHAVLMGDFNFDPVHEAEQARVEDRYRDIWIELRGGEAGYTENTDINLMRLHQKQQEKRVRFDRILLRSPAGGWMPRSVDLIGTEPISPERPDVFPSDHFGLVAELEWVGS